jgi:prepilin-type N-terminal cleavage/methylation domain-containing protein
MAKISFFKKGYSLVEVLIVITLIGIILPGVFSIVTVILRQQLVIYELSTIKREGDAVSYLIKDKITRDATGIVDDANTSQCVNATSLYTPSTPANFKFSSKAGNFYYDLSSTILRIDIGTASTPLHSNKIGISDLKLSCYKKGALSPAIVVVSYKVTYVQTTPNPVLGAAPSMDYQIRVALRSTIR